MSRTTHAADRAAERFGLEPDDGAWQQAIMDIIDTVAGDRHAALLLRSFPDGIELWLVKLCGTQVVVVYNPAEALIVTVQKPLPSIDNYDRRKQSRAGAGRVVERRQAGRWRYIADEHIA